MKINIRVVEKEKRIKRIIICRYHREYNIRTDITGVDYPEREKRFEVVYNRLSRRYTKRRRVKVGLYDGEKVETISKRYKSAEWREREVWDIYGIGFRKHENISRIRTDYGFKGNPRRKDYPLSGYTEVSYDRNRKGIKTTKLEISQIRNKK